MTAQQLEIAMIECGKGCRGHPSGVICEILNEDGTMARVPDLEQFCRAHQLKMITIADSTRYRLESDNEGLCGAIEGLVPAFALLTGDRQ